MFHRPNRNSRASLMARQSQQTYLREAANYFEFGFELHEKSANEENPEKACDLLLLAEKYYRKNLTVPGRTTHIQDKILLAMVYIDFLILAEQLPSTRDPALLFTDYLGKLADLLLNLPKDKRTPDQLANADPAAIYLLAVRNQIYAMFSYATAMQHHDLLQQDLGIAAVQDGLLFSQHALTLMNLLLKDKPAEAKSLQAVLQWIKNEMQMAQATLDHPSEAKPAPAGKKAKPVNASLLYRQSRENFLSEADEDYEFGHSLQQRGKEIASPEMQYDLQLLAIQYFRKNLNVRGDFFKRELAQAYIFILLIAPDLHHPHNPTAITKDFLEKLGNLVRDLPIDKRSPTEQMRSEKNLATLHDLSDNYNFHAWYHFFLSCQYMNPRKDEQVVAHLQLAVQYGGHHLALEEHLHDENFPLYKGSDKWLKGAQSHLLAFRHCLQDAAREEAQPTQPWVAMSLQPH